MGEKYPELNPKFIFSFPAYNLRNTEIGGVFGLSQLKRLDNNNEIRTRNLLRLWIASTLKNFKLIFN